MSGDTFAGLRTQARCSWTARRAAWATATAAAPPVPTFEVVFPKAIGALPRPDRGDLFFDFEGDPLYTEAADGVERVGHRLPVRLGRRRRAVRGAVGAFLRRGEAGARGFPGCGGAARRAHPGMHIYHYAPYEPTHLLAMAARYGVREAEVDTLLREGVFVDLYPIVRRALRVGSRSYSIKKLEPLYMGAEVRTSDVQRGDDSIVKYVEARELMDAGADAAGAAILDDLADYNRYDCVSTRRLRNWLVERAREAKLLPSADVDAAERPYEPSPRAEALTRMAGAAEGTMPPTSRGHRAQARRRGDRLLPPRGEDVLGDALLRLREPVSIWEDTRDVVVFDHRCRVLTDWHAGGRTRPASRDRAARRPRAGHEAVRGARLPAVRAADTVPDRHQPAMDPRCTFGPRRRRPR
jgi:uncharacterized protein